MGNGTVSQMMCDIVFLMAGRARTDYVNGRAWGARACMCMTCNSNN